MHWRASVSFGGFSASEMICLSQFGTLCAILALALVAGCQTKRPLNTGQQSPPLMAVAQEAERRGYHSKERVIVEPAPWEISTFRMRSKRLFSFRANQPQPGTRDYFCRFSLFEETYDSPADAQYRLANIHLSNPDGPAEERDYLSNLRTGFRVGNVAYVLQTDSSAFWDEVKRFAKELASATPGAELIRTTTMRPADGTHQGLYERAAPNAASGCRSPLG